MKNLSLSRKTALICDCVVVALFVFALFLPLTLLIATRRTSPPLSYEAEATLPELSTQSYLDGSLTGGVQDWFSKSWPLRSTLVLSYNQLKYDLENAGTSSDTPSQGQTDVLDADTASPEVSASEAETEPEAPLYSDFNPLYAEMNRLRSEDEMIEPTGYKGTDQVIIGKSGVLYENGYINEYMGYSKMYREVTPEIIDGQVKMLEAIQEMLAERGIAFSLVITPSKAAQYPDAIPEWYKLANSAPENYVRPYTMLIERLQTSALNYIDSSALYKEVGLDQTFPKTGIHWNKCAAFETIRATMELYEKQTGETVRHITADKVNKSKDPPGFGNPEQDIFGIVFAAVGRANVIYDDWYWWPEVYVENEDCDNRINVFLQGGSFCHDFTTYLPMFGITKKLQSVYYNQNDSLFGDEKTMDTAWKRYLKDCDYVIFECNEQFVRGMGGVAPQWARADKNGYDIGNRVYESLYEYLVRTKQ